MTQDEWPERLAAAISRELRRYREARGMSAQQLADACNREGFAVQRSVIANFENGRRASIGVAELLMFAHVLNVPPVLLICPAGREDAIEVLPGKMVGSYEAAQWISAKNALEETRSRDQEEFHRNALGKYRELLMYLERLEDQVQSIDVHKAKAERSGLDIALAEERYRDSVVAFHETLTVAEELKGDIRNKEEMTEDERKRYSRYKDLVEMAEDRRRSAVVEHHKALAIAREIGELESSAEDIGSIVRDVIAEMRQDGYIVPPISDQVREYLKDLAFRTGDFLLDV